MSPLRINTIKHLLDLHPDYTYYFFTDRTSNEFVKEKFPQYWELYDSFISGAYRADLFRGLALKYYGGYYLDCKASVIMPFGNWPYVICDDMLASIASLSFNGFMASPQNSELIDMYIRYIVDLAKTKAAYIGPLALTKAYTALKIEPNFMEYSPTVISVDDKVVKKVSDNTIVTKSRFPHSYLINYILI